MARNIRWQITFKSLNDTTCRVDIYDNDWPSGVVMPVRGAADPFYYEEDSSDDLLNGVIRYRTGYIRVVENYYGQLDDIRPESTFDRYVEFLYGGVVMFNGYIQVQDFSHTLEFSTQQDPCPHVVEFPVISPMGLFDKRTFPQILPPTTKTIGQLLDMILSGSTYTKVVLPNITSVGFWQTIYSLVVSPWNKDYHHSMTYDAVHKVMKPESYAYLIEAICKAFGWICHDTPTALVFTMFDHPDTYIYYDVGHIGDANYKHNESIGTTAVALTDYYSLADDNARVDTLLPDTGIQIDYDGDLGKAEFSFQRTIYDGVERDPNDTGDPDEKFSICNLSPVSQLFEISNVGRAEFDSQGRIDYGSAVVAWNGHIGVLSSLSTSDPDGFLLFTIRLYTKNPAGCSWTVSFDGMASSDGNGTYHPGIGGLRDDDKVTEYYVQTEHTVYDDYFEVSFKYHFDNNDYPQLPDHTLLFIHNINFTFTENNQLYAEYRFMPASKSDYIPSLEAKVSSSITMPISFYRFNSNMIGDSVLSTRLTEYDYLFDKRMVLTGKFRWAASIDLAHARMWSYLSKKWRLIAQSFHPWDDEYELTLQNSIVLDAIRHSITASAANTSLDGYTDNVYDGRPFSHLLTPGTGYSITSVVITMGGNDITSTAYDSATGQISIASVTGDVVITAVAETYYDAEVEYLQSENSGSGRPFIDTGVKTSANIKFEIKTAGLYAADTHPIGGRTGVNNNTFYPMLRYSGQIRWYYGSSYYSKNITPATGTAYILKNTSGANKLYFGNTEIGGPTSEASFSLDYNIYLFAINSGGSNYTSTEAVIRIYYAKIYDSSGNLVRDFIPVRKNGVGYMFDKVSKTLFGNANTVGQQFTYGNDVNS